MDDPIGRTASAYGATESDRLKSNKSGSPDLCSMGGAGRSHGRHRTRNVGVRDSGHFKLDHQKHMSQSFAADVTTNTELEAPEPRNIEIGHRNWSNRLSLTSKSVGTKGKSEEYAPEQLLDLREKGRPKKKAYPMPRDSDTVQMDTDTEDDESVEQEYASSDESTDCESYPEKRDGRNDCANIAKSINTDVRGQPRRPTGSEKLRDSPNSLIQQMAGSKRRGAEGDKNHRNLS